MTKEQVIHGYLMNSPKVVAEMLYDTIEKYENKKCENCTQWVGNAPFKGFCNVTGSSCCLGGCNDYFEPKG